MGPLFLCADKGLECLRPSKSASFRPGSAARLDANFPKDQRWVHPSQSSTFSFSVHTSNTYRKLPPEGTAPGSERGAEPPPEPGAIPPPPPPRPVSGSAVTTSPVASADPNSPLQQESVAEDAGQPRQKRPRVSGMFSPAAFLESPESLQLHDSPAAPVEGAHVLPPMSTPQEVPPLAPAASQVSAHSPAVSSRTLGQTPVFVPSAAAVPDVQQQHGFLQPEPFANILEATLLRYFIDELAAWFDLCDEERHFQLVVPQRARFCQPLMNAIFACSVRHLSRPSRYRIPGSSGVTYRGQVFPDLTDHDAVAYMLECLPALRQFHQTADDEYRSNLVAAAVILRQFEEMDVDEDDHSGGGGEEERATATIGGHATTGAGAGAAPSEEASPSAADDDAQQVNFLAITKAFLEDAIPSSSSPGPTSPGHRLVGAAAWIVLRQEVYSAFTRERCPRVAWPRPEQWLHASAANRLVLHTADVARWRWGPDRSVAAEWARLKEQEAFIEQHYASQLVPIFDRKADRSKGEVFPTILYQSDVEVTCVQHFIIAKMVLVAEDPALHRPSAPRAAQRRAENLVRSLVLDLCGIALQHADTPPNLVNASLGITAYGDYFVEEYERGALRQVIGQLSSCHAWPVKKALARLGS
ncbi:hypothetical protein GGR56DRAFT_693443 [Xylariaceae sp. FL0804]|nr:hypothetical protein GGR56DRAFT_693443 [Xylariaceae sp. FL0804]